MTRGDDIAPIPGTKRVARVEENTAADGIELTADQIERLDTLTPAAGARHNEANMSTACVCRGVALFPLRSGPRSSTQPKEA